MDKQIFEKWLATGTVKTGEKLFVNQSEWAALADLARDEILTLRSRGSDFTNSADAEKVVAQMRADRKAREAARGSTPKPAAVTQPAPAATPAAASPVASRPAIPAGGSMTADAFRASVAKPTMTRAEFEKLTHPERNEYIRNGGKLA